MMTESYREFARRLTLGEKIGLRDYLSQVIANTPMIPGYDKDRAEKLLEILNDITGRKNNPFVRDQVLVWERTMVAYQMILEGYTLQETGVQLGKSHATIMHLRNKMRDALDLPQAYQDILPIWNEFQKRIQQ